ncbi:MAG: HNH endonuclease [Leptolyngbyaceae cyanobacterium SM1_3_5]|nr:HNH endonuclease [Leptolyngbyaceae cyanobacterium SM1_3_5]
MSKTYVTAELRRLVVDRAQSCCEYCLIPESLVLASHQVDHVIAEKHGGETSAANLALSCSLCNQAKGSDIASIDPTTGEVVRLYHPRQDCWHDHFQLEADTGMLQPLSAIGRVTVRLLQLNRVERVSERKLLIRAGVLKSGEAND